MKNVSVVILGLVFLLVSLTLDAQAQDSPAYPPQPIKFEILLEKKIYQPHEDIVGIECTFINVTQEDIIFNADLFGHLDFIIKNSQGITLAKKTGKLNTGSAYLSQGSFMTLKPGQTYQVVEQIPVTPDSPSYYELKPDIYSIQARYNNLPAKSVYDVNAWNGILTSDFIVIEVEKNS